MYKRIVTIAEIFSTESTGLPSLTKLNQFVQAERRYYRELKLQSMLIIAGHHLLCIIEGDDNANVENAIQRARSAHIIDNPIRVIDTYSPERILTSPLRLIPKDSHQHLLIVEKLRSSDRASLRLDTDEAVSLWKQFSDWETLPQPALSTFKGQKLMLADWPHTTQLTLDDDEIVACAILMGKETRYEELAARNILNEDGLETLLSALTDIGLLKATRYSALSASQVSQTTLRTAS